MLQSLGICRCPRLLLLGIHWSFWFSFGLCLNCFKMRKLSVMVTAPCSSCLYFTRAQNTFTAFIMLYLNTSLRVLVWRIICWLMGKGKAKKGWGWTGRGCAGWFVMVSCSPLFHHQLLHELQALELKSSRWFLLNAANLLSLHTAVLTAPLQKLAVTVSTSVEVCRVKYVHISHDHIAV